MDRLSLYGVAVPAIGGALLVFHQGHLYALPTHAALHGAASATGRCVRGGRLLPQLGGAVGLVALVGEHQQPGVAVLRALSAHLVRERHVPGLVDHQTHHPAPVQSEHSVGVHLGGHCGGAHHLRLWGARLELRRRLGVRRAHIAHRCPGSGHDAGQNAGAQAYSGDDPGRGAIQRRLRLHAVPGVSVAAAARRQHLVRVSGAAAVPPRPGRHRRRHRHGRPDALPAAVRVARRRHRDRHHADHVVLGVLRGGEPTGGERDRGCVRLWGGVRRGPLRLHHPGATRVAGRLLGGGVAHYQLGGVCVRRFHLGGESDRVLGQGRHRRRGHRLRSGAVPHHVFGAPGGGGGAVPGAAHWAVRGDVARVAADRAQRPARRHLADRRTDRVPHPQPVRWRGGAGACATVDVDCGVADAAIPGHHGAPSRAPARPAASDVGRGALLSRTSASRAPTVAGGATRHAAAQSIPICRLGAGASSGAAALQTGRVADQRQPGTGAGASSRSAAGPHRGRWEWEAVLAARERSRDGAGEADSAIASADPRAHRGDRDTENGNSIARVATTCPVGGAGGGAQTAPHRVTGPRAVPPAGRGHRQDGGRGGDEQCGRQDSFVREQQGARLGPGFLGAVGHSAVWIVAVAESLRVGHPVPPIAHRSRGGVRPDDGVAARAAESPRGVCASVRLAASAADGRLPPHHPAVDDHGGRHGGEPRAGARRAALRAVLAVVGGAQP
eukprot:ctg_1865.g529